MLPVDTEDLHRRDHTALRIDYCKTMDARCFIEDRAVRLKNKKFSNQVYHQGGAHPSKTIHRVGR
jgi:hypothetical protein